jgi:hypothetical protein
VSPDRVLVQPWAAELVSNPQLLVLLPLLALWLWCLADVVQADERVVRGLSKQQWIFMVILTNVIGGLLWLAFGRPNGPR